MGPIDDERPGVPNVLSLLVDSLNRVESKIDSGIARLEAKMDAKADRSEVKRIELTLGEHNTRLSNLERENGLREERRKVHLQRDERTVLSRKAWWALAGSAITVLATLALAITAIIQTLH